MCRWIAYKGEPVFLETLVAAPHHSLIAQSLQAHEAKTATNGDGFGIGWYGEREEPGLYREVRPAWSDENLRAICAQVRSPLFFAHVRASTGSASARANCHPFAFRNWLFMHNGQIGGFARIKRKIEALIPDNVYPARAGATDSEALFLAAIGFGLERDPVGAMAQTLARVHDLMLEAGIGEALRFTAAVTDGRDLFCFRWASDSKAPTLYYRDSPHALVVVSEPLDTERGCWHQVPQGCTMIVRTGERVVTRCMHEAIRLAA